MPPIDGPITACTIPILSFFNSSFAALAISSTDKTGNESRYGSSVSGFILIGLVEPKQLPREFTQRTKNSFVFIGLLGPTMSSHQPVEGSSLDEHACAEGDNPVKIRMQFERSEDNVPHVS